MININCPSKCKSEIRYIIKTIFTDFLKLEYNCNFKPELSRFEITLENGRTLKLSSTFFDQYEEKKTEFKMELNEVSYFQSVFLPEENAPLLFGNGLVNLTEFGMKCDVDVLGTCFFILARIEEYWGGNRDIHNRISYRDTIASKWGFGDRPIVDEYVEFIFNMLKSLDRSIQRKKIEPKKIVTCDVDWPFDPVRLSLYRSIKTAMGWIIKRKKIGMGIKVSLVYLLNKLGFEPRDENLENLKWIMTENEKRHNSVEFYFISLNTSKLDHDFKFGSQKMRKLLKIIVERGHKIGLHPGYGTFDDEGSFQESVNVLKSVLKEEGLPDEQIGGRQHFLKWAMETTPDLWEKNGLIYDSSLGFHDISGFRCGTSKEFFLFDAITQRVRDLKERPLIIMDCALLEGEIETFRSRNEIEDRVNYYKNRCYKYSGNFVVLWHNSYFNINGSREIYRKMIGD